MAFGIYTIDWVVIAIQKQICSAKTRLCFTVRVDEATNIWVVISALQVIEPRLAGRVISEA